MKKMRKMVAASMSGLFAMMAVFSMPIVSFAKTITNNDEVWHNYCKPNTEPVETDIPLCVTVDIANKDFDLGFPEGFFVDGDAMIAQLTVNGDIYEPGDTVTVELPFSGSFYLVNVYSEVDYDGKEYGTICWEVAGYTSNSVTLKCLK